MKNTIKNNHRIQHSIGNNRDISDMVRPKRDKRSERRRVKDEVREAVNNYYSGQDNEDEGEE